MSHPQPLFFFLLLPLSFFFFFCFAHSADGNTVGKAASVEVMDEKKRGQGEEAAHVNVVVDGF